ncbi:hypothetical protein PAL_GLEAN10017488 [Pteropus alecto]|uniref:Uncharacterized protein n=1 Tax=Pteropus alecto TaxID=9402 RepID=L5K2R3_PTEAL|nr:hypothetical protein PAL_GLEAN10017488 [Pteropus alecto]
MMLPECSIALVLLFARGTFRKRITLYSVMSAFDSHKRSIGIYFHSRRALGEKKSYRDYRQDFEKQNDAMKSLRLSFALRHGRLLEPLAPTTPINDGRGGDGDDNTSHFRSSIYSSLSVFLSGYTVRQLSENALEIARLVSAFRGARMNDKR